MKKINDIYVDIALGLALAGMFYLTLYGCTLIAWGWMQ